jgi:hypothetical protein
MRFRNVQGPVTYQHDPAGANRLNADFCPSKFDIRNKQPFQEGKQEIQPERAWG